MVVVMVMVVALVMVVVVAMAMVVMVMVGVMAVVMVGMMATTTLSWCGLIRRASGPRPRPRQLLPRRQPLLQRIIMVQMAAGALIPSSLVLSTPRLRTRRWVNWRFPQVPLLASHMSQQAMQHIAMVGTKLSRSSTTPNALPKHTLTGARCQLGAQRIGAISISTTAAPRTYRMALTLQSMKDIGWFGRIRRASRPRLRPHD
jgi:hypothetical protein